MTATTWVELSAQLGPQGYVADAPAEDEPEDEDTNLQEFDVWIRYSGSERITVEAASRDDAIAEAWNLARSGQTSGPDDWEADDVEVTA